VRVVRPSDAMAMKQWMAGLQAADPTYSDLGATLVGGRPEGFNHDHYEVELGKGLESFERAVRGLKAWEAHHLPGIRIFPANEAIRQGASVVITLGLPFIALVAPCRIVGVIDEETRWGFAYGTLPGHPEQGEEAFIVSISPDETVRFEISAFSRPAGLLVRMSGPLGRNLQRVGAKGYLRALQRFVTD
jgi:uncharacterized protein (UPF0548 family)